MNNKKTKKYAIDEDITTTGLSATGFIRFDSGSKDYQIIQKINSSTESVVFFTGNAKDFKNKLKKDHQLVGVSRQSIPKEQFNDYVTKASEFIKRKTGTKKHKYLRLTKTESGELILIGSPSSKQQQIFKIPQTRK